MSIFTSTKKAIFSSGKEQVLNRDRKRHRGGSENNETNKVGN